jgi:murein hydrolase activator
MRLKYFYILVIFFVSSVSFADYNYKDDLSRQINIYKFDIEKLNVRIEEIKAQIKNYEALLGKLNDSVVILSAFMEKSPGLVSSDPKNKYLSDEAKLIKAKEKIESMKTDFLKKMLFLYKHGDDFNTQIVFSSKSLNDFYVRLEYLNKVSEMRKKDFDRLKRELMVLEEKRKLSKLNRDEYLRYLKEKKEAQKNLIVQKTNQENNINSLKDEIEMILRQIERKNSFIDKIERELFNFNISTVYRIDQIIDYNDKPFWELKGKLIFPVHSVNIMTDFGKSINPESKTITYNNGIDVSIAKGSEIKCIAEGKVEIVTYIPYFGNVIIINHEGNYRSIYAIVKEVAVRNNQQVHPGDVIAKTSENNSGQCFHFEIWKDNSPLDPKQWLRRGANIN